MGQFLGKVVLVETIEDAENLEIDDPENWLIARKRLYRWMIPQ